MIRSSRSAGLASAVRRITRRGAVAAVTAVTLLAVVGPVTSAPAASSAAKPGIAGAIITVAKGVSFDGDNRAYDLATDKFGTAYLVWIAAKETNTELRQIHLCTLPPRATGCKGGVQTLNTPEAQSAAGLRLLVTPSGALTILWYITGSTGQIEESTSQQGSPLTAATEIATGPADGELLDAEFGPGGQIWTVVYPPLPAKTLDVRPGVTNTAVAIKTPYEIGYASLAFAGSTPILAITKIGAISQPVAYSYRPGASWKGFKNVHGTWASGRNLGLTRTSSGVRLTTAKAYYYPVVAKWNGHGFTHPRSTGDHNSCTPDSHDTSTDASGRLIDVTDECSRITVSNLANTTHAAVLRFGAPVSATTAGGSPQITSTPRGHAWVAWSIESAKPGAGDILKIVPFLLPGPHRKVSRHGSHGTITVTGPASCLPADLISVGVSGHGKNGWAVTKRTLRLGHKKVHHSINGAALVAGKKYKLIGKVTFAGGGSHQTLKATVAFRSCPNP